LALTNRTFFFISLPINAVSFPSEAQIILPFLATKIIIINDSKNQTIDFSFRRPNLDGILTDEDGAITFDGLSESKIWFRATASANIRLWAWRL